MALAYNSQDSSLDGEVHFLELEDPYVKRTLCFPSEVCRDYSERLERLLSDGFIYLLETGTRVMGSRYLGKGYSSIVVAARHSKLGLGALKILRSDSRRKSLQGEAEILTLIQGLGVSPRLYSHGDFYIFLEILPPGVCFPLHRVLESLVVRGDFELTRSILINTLKKLHGLDRIRVDHGELNRPGGHLYYCEGGRVVILDWESAKTASRPVNLTSFVSYLVFRFKYRDVLGRVLNWRLDRVLTALKTYKSAYSSTEYGSVLNALGLE